jgi:modulator of FtsH protease
MYSTRYPSLSTPLRSASSLAYIRRVYALFLGGILFVIAGGLVALYSGTPYLLRQGLDSVEIPPLVAFGLQHPIVSMFGFMGSFFAASALRRRPGVNLAALFGFTFVTGLYAAPSIFIAQMLASRGDTLSASPVRDALLLTGAAFTGMTTYAFVSKRDFSFLGAALSTGVWVLLGASLLGMFFHSSAFHLAVASLGVLVFAGYILFDTVRILQDGEDDDAIGAALRLFLDVFNLFLSLLQILSAGSRRE